MLRRQKHALSQSTTPFACTLHKLLRVSAQLRFAGRCGWTMRKATNSYADMFFRCGDEILSGLPRRNTSLAMLFRKKLSRDARSC